MARKLDKADREALSRSAFYLQKMEQYAYASEVYSKMGDIKSLASLLVEAKLWEEVNIFEFASELQQVHVFSSLRVLHVSSRVRV